MHYNKEHWNQETYHAFIDELHTLIDTKYQTFQQGLIPTGAPVLGIRTPLLKNIAKEISKGNYPEFLKQVKQDSYEEILLYGLVISYVKLPWNDMIVLLDNFIPMIDNWAINDIIAVNVKSFKQNQEAGFIYIQTLLDRKEPWAIRFGLVLLLSHYINDTYIDSIFEIVESTFLDEYYVKMALAWLISICYIQYREKTNYFLCHTKIDDWVYHKAISKICDSYRVSKEEKAYLRALKR